jgi:sulfopyruvate decarboxylase subunit beta
MMRRDLAFRILARHIADAIVVPVYQAAQEWRAIKPDHALTYYSIGAMGQASSAALGLALGRPDKRVIVLDGDGSLLMNLGSLVSIAAAAPRNLLHFVCENGVYESNGKHPIPGRDKVDFTGLARAAGYRHCHQFSDLATFESEIGGVLREDGPVFVDLKIESGAAQSVNYEYIYSRQLRDTFRDALRRS